MKPNTIFKFLTLLLLTYNIAQAQSVNKLEQDKKYMPIDDIYNDWLWRGKYENITCDTLYYTDKIEDHIIDSTINVLFTNNTFKTKSSKLNFTSPPLVLTDSEKNYLIAELEKLKQFKWSSGLFPKSKAIKQSEIVTSLDVTEHLKTEPERYMCSIVYTFSRPIFIRDNTICLYLDQKRYRTNYTQLEFDFYIKERNRWEEYAQVYIHYESQKTK